MKVNENQIENDNRDSNSGRIQSEDQHFGCSRNNRFFITLVFDREYVVFKVLNMTLLFLLFIFQSCKMSDICCFHGIKNFSEQLREHEHVPGM